MLPNSSPCDQCFWYQGIFEDMSLFDSSNHSQGPHSPYSMVLTKQSFMTVSSEGVHFIETPGDSPRLDLTGFVVGEEQAFTMEFWYKGPLEYGTVM